MGRRGHQPLASRAFGAAFGPPRTLSCLEGVLSEKLAHGEVLETGVSGTGSQKVLVGTDGSPESQAALRTAIDLLGSRIGAISLAGVVPFEGELPGTSAAGHLAEAGLGGHPRARMITSTLVQVHGSDAHARATPAQMPGSLLVRRSDQPTLTGIRLATGASLTGTGTFTVNTPWS